KHQADQFDETDAEAEGDQKLILVRAVIEMADDDPLHQYADDHDEQRARDHRDDERAGVLERDITGVAAEHEHRAMREVEHPERAIDDGQPGTDERKQSSQRQAVEYLRNEIRPINHLKTIVEVDSKCDSALAYWHKKWRRRKYCPAT